MSSLKTSAKLTSPAENTTIENNKFVNHEENIIEVRNLSFTYNGNDVLSHANLTVHRGDYLAVVGGNGAGKTTLLKIMLGLLKPTSGTVHIFGTNLADFKDWHRIGYVPQKATSFDAAFPATVLEVVLMGRYARRGLFHGTTEEDRQKSLEALQAVDMEPFQDRLIGDLSGGQQQRVFIARALAGQPEIIFLDEPTAGVEKGIRKQFYDLLQTLNKDLHLTVVIVTHDVEDMAHEAMHVACLDCTLFYHESVGDYFTATHLAEHPHDTNKEQ